MIQGLFKRRMSRRLADVKEAGVPKEVVRCSVNEEGMIIDRIIPFR